MATPEDNNPLAEIQKSLANLQKIPPSTLAAGGVAAATKAAAGITPEGPPPDALSEINASLARIGTSAHPPIPGPEFAASAVETPVVQAPAGAPSGPNPLDEITASLAKLQATPTAEAQAPAAATPVGAVPRPPEEDINLPWSDRLSKRFHEAWNAPGEGTLGRTWGTINAPIISETDLESWLGNPTEQFGTLFGGITKGVYSLLGGMTSPLSLGFILGTAGVGGLIEGGAAATLRVAGGMGAGEIATVVKGSEVLAKSIKAGMTAKEAMGAMELAGINSSVVSKGLDVLSKAGLTSHDLIKGNMIRTAGAAALRGVGMQTTKAERVGQGIALLIDGGFTAQNVYGAAVAWPSALDALKEGDTELAARLITEATGITGFGLLGAKTFLKDAGGMMDDFQVNMGLKVKPSDENLLLQREFGLADRQMTEAGRTHELWAEDMRKLYKTVTSSPDGPALVRNFVDAGGDEATMQRNYDLILKSAGRQQVSPASLLTIDPEIAEAPKVRTRKTQATVIPKPLNSVPLYESEKYAGGNVSQVFDTYHKAAEVLSDQNPYVRRSSDPVKSAKSTTNEGRTLLVQISSNLMNQNVGRAAEKLQEAQDLDTVRSARPLAKAGEAVTEAVKPELTPDEMAVQYYDKLYSNTRPGYARLHDFWEIPDWIARASHFLPDADLYVVRSVEAAKQFLNDAKYDRVLFSALDVNRDIIKSILYSEENKSGYSGRVDMGGYIDPAFFKDQPNVNWHDSLETMASAMGAEFKPGVDYRHFQGSDTIPRLTLSQGCLHKCAFCVIANTELKLTPEEVVNQQVGEIAKLGAKLVYVNDKTFGQAKNYQDLAAIYEKIKKENPAFHGFAVQTTAAQLNKIPEEWLKTSGIKYVELGIESFNDPILKEMRKPANERLINQGTDKLRRNGIALIPNIIVGYPGETAATYKHTMDFLVQNRDIISHANVYNLALYKDVELGKKMTTAADGDFNENILEKSWHTDPNVVKKFAGDLYGMLQQKLDQVPDVLQPLRPLSELTPTEIKQLSVGKRAEVFLNVLQQAPEVKELVAAAKAGSKGRDWYDRSIKAFDAMRELAPGYFKPEDVDVWAGILAATSPQQSVVMNLREALTFWKEWKDNGSPTTAEEIIRLQKKKKITPFVNQGAKLPNAVKAINRETMLPADKDMYYKVGNFARNLQDIFKDPSGTFDSWMGVFFGFDERKVPTASFYHAMAVQTRLAARELGWSPKQAQAAIWSFTKTLSESSGWKGSGEHEKYRPAEVLDFMVPDDYSKYSKDFADLMHQDPEVRAKLHAMGVNVNELDKRLQAIPKPAPVEGANEAATSEVLRRAAERIGEAQQKLEGFREYSEYFPGERFDFEREVAETPEGAVRGLNVEESKRWRELLSKTQLEGEIGAEARLGKEAQKKYSWSEILEYADLRKKIGDYHALGRTDHGIHGKEDAIANFKRVQKGLGTDKISVDIMQSGSFHSPYHEFTLSEKHGTPRTLAQFEKLWDAAERADAQAYEAAYKDLWGPDDIDAEITAARPKTETPEFKRWFSGSKLVDSEGKPVVMYHGTVRDFTEFSKRKGNVEGDWGQGHYFTNTPEDVNINYAGLGPDLKNKMEDRADQILSQRALREDPDESVSYGTDSYRVLKAAALEQAKREMMPHGGAVLPTYLALKNPLNIGGASEPRWDLAEVRKLISGVRRASTQIKTYDFDVDALRKLDIYDLEGRPASNVIEAVEKTAELWSATSSRNKGVGKELVRRAIEYMGYDGIIDHTVAEKFHSMEGMGPETFHAIAFKPTQVKSATGNVGTFDPANPDLRAEIRVSGFFSPLKRAVVTLPDRIGSKSVEKWLTNRGVTKLELEESGLPEFLAGAKRTVSKSEIRQFISETAATVSEKLLGAGAQVLTPEDQMWLAQFQKMERKRGHFAPKFTPEETQRYAAIKAKLEAPPTQYETHLRPFEAGAVPNSYRELVVRSVPAKLETEYKGTHYPKEGNVLGWLRFDERVTPDGKRTMFLQEVQEGDAVKQLKKSSPEVREKAIKEAPAAIKKAEDKLKALLEEKTPGITDPEAALRKLWTEFREAVGRRDPLPTVELERQRWSSSKGGQDYAAIEAAKNEVGAARGYLRLLEDEAAKAPKVPYAANWFHVLLKRALHYAAENGYDQVAWTSGEHQNTRWDLRKVVDTIAYNSKKNILQARTLDGKWSFHEAGTTPEKLPDYVGKDLSQKLLKAEPAKWDPDFRELSGKDIEIGGKGMLGFYGSQKTGELGMIGEFYRGYGKKWGARVGKTEIPAALKPDKIQTAQVHAVGVTPEMKSEILGAGQNISKEYAPAQPLEPGSNYMMDPKGALHKLATDETHRQWIERNFSDPKAGVDQRRADFDRALEEGYVRVRNEKDGLLIEASKLNPTWAKDVDHIERLSPGDKPVKLDTFQKGSLKQHHFEDPQEFRDWLNMQRESASIPRGWGSVEPRGFAIDAEGHPLAQFAGIDTTALENLSPFMADKLNRLGNEVGQIKDPDTGQQVVGLYKNERGENTLVLAGRGFEALNKVLKGALTNLNGASARAEAAESMVNFMERHPNQYIKDLAAALQPVKGEPLTFLMLTGPDPFATLLHEHVHGALSEVEVKAAHEAMSQLPGYDEALTEISGIAGIEGRSYSSEAQIVNEMLPRLLAGQLRGKGIKEEHLVKLTWEALNALEEQHAYEKILGNIHPDVRGKFDAYIYPERAAEGRAVPEQLAEGTPGGSQARPGVAEVSQEPRRGGVRPGDEGVQPTQAQLDQLVSAGLVYVTKQVPLEAPHSKLAGALQNVKITEGFTVNPATGFVPRSEGFAVEAIPERRKTFKRDITIKDIEAFAEQNKVLLEAHPELFVGGYGKELNISTVLKTAEAAKEFGKRLDQEAAWDFAKGEALNLGGTGKTISFESFPLDERLALARRNSVNVDGPAPQIQRELGEAPRDTSEARLHELAAQQHIKANYNDQEIDALLRSYNPKSLTDQHRALAGDVKKHFNGNFERASAGGALEEGLENYVTHLWEKDADNPAANRLLADARAGTFAVNTSMARHRTFNHAIEGQLLGRKLAITDPIALAARNGNTFDRVLAARKTLERLQDKGTRASDGRPMVALSGTGKLVQGPDGENEAVIVQADKVRSIRIAEKVVDGLRRTGDLDKLVKEGRIVKYGEVKPSGSNSKGSEHYAWATHDYRSVEHPSFEGWQFASQDTNGNPVLVRGDLKVHPEAYQYVKRQLETTSPLAKAFKPVFTAGSEAKATLLSFDTFHLVQESLRALMTGVSPFGVERWDLRTNPTLGKLVEHGLSMKNYGPRDTFQEGMLSGYQHSKLLGMIPVAGKISHWFEGFLFDKYIPSLKARAAEHLYNRYKKTYPEYSDSKVAQLAATDTNNRFGGLNLRREGRSLLTQDVFRLVALAPDWMESELRSISRAMGGDGKVVRQDLAKVTIAMWLAARVLSQLNTGNPHYEAPFGVAYKDEEGRDKLISLRTLPTDMLHSVTDPLKFMRYRASPLERTVTTVYTGRDSQGRRLPARDLVWDLLANTVIPMPLQNVTQKLSGFAPTRSWGELGLQTAGAQILQAKTAAQQKAMELSADRIESGPVDRDKLKEHTVKLEIEDRLRSGSIQPQELWDMVDQDLISPREAKTIMGNINKTKGLEVSIAKLFLRSSRLPMSDFLLVWEEANNAEKAALTPLMLKKKTSYFKKAFTEYSAAERQTDATYLKLRKLFPEQPPF